MVLLLALLAGVFTGCGVHRAMQAEVHEADGMQVLSSTAASLNLTFFGDYAFGSWKGANRRDLSAPLLKLLQQPLNGHRGSFVFAAHTTIEPYFNGVLLRYTDEATALAYAQKDSAQLKTSGRPAGCTIESVPLDGRVFYRVSYVLRNEEEDKLVRFDDYFTPLGSQMLRFIFWTTEVNEDSFRNESQDILATLKQPAYP